MPGRFVQSRSYDSKILYKQIKSRTILNIYLQRKCNIVTTTESIQKRLCYIESDGEKIINQVNLANIYYNIGII